MPTPADDLYALGVVLYWMLTGRHAFVEVETPTQVEEVISHVPPAPHVANPRVPRGLSQLAMRLLSKHPEERGTAKALCADVEAALAGADADWDVPLCDEHPAVPEPPRAWPEDDDAALELWVNAGSEDEGPPRRGRRPGAAAPPLAAPTAVATVPLEVTAQKEDTPVKKTPSTVPPPRRLRRAPVPPWPARSPWPRRAARWAAPAAGPSSACRPRRSRALRAPGGP